MVTIIPKEEHKEVFEELELIKEMLDRRNIVYEVKQDGFIEETCKDNYVGHVGIYSPSKSDFKFLISFDVPFDGYRISTSKKHYEPYNKNIDDVKHFISSIKKRKGVL